MTKTLSALLSEKAQACPETPALCFPDSGGRLTFADWEGEAQRLARAMIAAGIGPGSSVGLLAENRLEWPVVEMAAAYCGALFVPLNTHYQGEELRYILSHAEVQWLFCSSQFRNHDYAARIAAIRPSLSSLQQVIKLPDGPKNDPDGYLSLDGPEPEWPVIAPDDPAMLLYTSGTTGFPKGAVISHGAAFIVAEGVCDRLKVTSSDRWTSMIPLFHCAGCIMNVIGSLCRGATYVGLPIFSPDRLMAVIEAESCTMLSGVPTAFFALRDHPKRQDYDLKSLRAGTCGGADADPELLRSCTEAFPIPGLVNVYGLTESATIIACPALDDPDRVDCSGPALGGGELRIVDVASDQDLPSGEVGQILYQGPNVMQSYYKQPLESAATIDEDGWLSTGDLGFLNAQGKLVLAGGRLKDMIIRGGENIYPVEVENCLQYHPGVSQAAVFGVPDPYYGEVPAAAVILMDAVTQQELTEHCKASLAGFKVPAHWFLVDDFPKTASGKVRKVELAQWVLEGKLPAL